MLSFGSLFSGIGGFDLGFEQAAMQCAWQVENDAGCNTVLAHHWPNVRRYEDVRDCGSYNLKPVNIISGGFPCQDLSVAGKREGLAGKRSRLWFEFIRVIEELKPEWVVIENVTGLLSSYSGDKPPGDLQPGQRWTITEESDLAIILQGLAQCGYWWAYRICDAQFWRVAQRRRRVFIVGCVGNMGGLEQAQSRQGISELAGLPAKVLFESDSLPWDTAPRRQTGSGVTATVKASSPSRRGGGSWPIAEEFVVVDPAYALAASVRGTGDGHGQGWNSNYVVAKPLNAHAGRGQEDSEHFVVAFNWQSGGDVRLGLTEECVTALHSSQTPAVAICENQRAEVRLTPYTWQLATGGGKPGQGYLAALTQLRVRRLTPTECERLQGFPDGWTAVNGQSDSARYKQLGNAVCVPVAKWIGERICLAHGTRPYNNDDNKTTL